MKQYKLFLVFISLLILSFVDPTSIVSYIYTLIIFALINNVIIKEQKFNNFLHLHMYLFLAIVIFAYQKYTIPSYLGLTGPEGGIGTDDVRYYGWLVNGNVPYPIRFNLNEPHNFARFLNFFYPFAIRTPLNIIIFNLIGISFLPFYTFKLTTLITEDLKVANLAQKLILFCPYTIAMGVIIMRDIWITTFVVSGIYYFTKRKYWSVLILALLIGFIRFGSIIFLFVGVFVFGIDNIRDKYKQKGVSNFLIFLISTFVILLIYISLPYIDIISGGKLSSGLFRIEMFSTLSQMDENATILKLMSLPIFIRTITLTLFFYFLPFLNFNFAYNGIFNIRFLLLSLSPIYLILLWRYIFKVILNTIFKNNNITKIKNIVLLSFLFALCLGTVSLQARHKTVLFPFLYILAAYGVYMTSKRFNKLSIILSFFLVAVQIFALL